MPDKTAECSGSGQSRSTAGRSKFRSNVTVAMSPCWKKKDLAVSLQMTGQQDLVSRMEGKRGGGYRAQDWSEELVSTLELDPKIPERSNCASQQGSERPEA
ncbi:hypothetical protein BO79DRAFT_272553 [Aspergillus costaricaensis CBS 115574]|uniref:Uncharacterized protein n=1 Tax=Aspergillus costaricaensis CBS 115574 TaxID=1448317 RepID=A0ACD1IRE7_9EURO|nr:hypothetical protein BO79DRAFT_272553 [Aspergillus costaricaensis CBS 115574]RAK93159.1 hypothetical protein BO79DRAFT_272553 [Aspergillus costaricaensis CBS 115574]